MIGFVLNAMAAIPAIPVLASTSTVTCSDSGALNPALRPTSCLPYARALDGVVHDFVNGRAKANSKLRNRTWDFKMPRRTGRPDQAKKGHDVLDARSLTVSSPFLGIPTLTVGQIAEQLSPVALSKARPANEFDTGPGKGCSRRSPATTPERGSVGNTMRAASCTDAAILNAVASAGLHVITQQYLLDALSMARDARHKWDRAGSRGKLFLEISHKAAGGDPVIAIHEDAVECDPGAGLSIVINLARIFDDLRKGATREETTPNTGRASRVRT